MKTFIRITALIFVLLATQANADVDPHLYMMNDFSEQPYGLLGTWANQPGAQNAKTVLVKLVREATAPTNGLVRIDVKYPTIPSELRLQAGFPQIGHPFKCGLRAQAASSFEIVQVNQVQSSFKNLDPEARSFDAVNGNSTSDLICSVTLRALGKTVITDWSTVVSAGLPDVKVRTEKLLEKSYANIAQPYIDFLQDDEVTIRTDDELWFLASASIYQEPLLTANLLDSSPEYVKNWIKNFALFVADQAPKYQKSILRSIANPPSKIQNTYIVNSVSGEVTYEL